MMKSPNKSYPYFLLLAVVSLLPYVVEAQTYPLVENSFSNPDFVKWFIGSYTPDTEREPKINSDESLLFEAVAPLVEADPNAAIQMLRDGITAESSAALDYTLASIYLQNGRFQEANKTYEIAIRKFPKFMRAYKNLGLTKIQIGDYSGAKPFIIKAIELGDRDGNTYGLLAYCHLNDGDFTSALDTYRIAQVLKPANKDWKVGKAHSLVQTGEYRQAIAIMGEMLLEDPNADRYWLSRANSFLALDETDMAAYHLEVVRRMGKATPASLVLLGDMYVNMGLFHVAVRTYLEAFSGQSRANTDTIIRIARNFAARYALEESEAIIAKAKDVFANSLSKSQKLELLNIEAEIALNQSADEKAATILEKVIELDPMNGRALLLLGEYHFSLKDYETAEFYVERVEMINGFKVEALVQHARIKVALREFGDAVKLLRRSQQIDFRDNVEDYLQAVEKVYEANSN